MNVKQIDAKLYKAIMMGFQYQINCEITPEQCKELVDFIDNPIELEEVCEWVLEEYEMCISPHNNGNWCDKDEYQFCPTCGKRIKYVASISSVEVE